MGKARAGEPGLSGTSPWEAAGQGILLQPGAGRGTGTAGAGPQSRSCRGALDSPGKPGAWKSLWLSSQPSQAWCSSLLGGLPAPSASLLLTPPARAAGREPSFPVFLSKDNHLQHAQLGRGLQLPPCHPLLCFQQAQPQPDGKPKAFYSTVGCSRGVGKSCQATAAPREAGAVSGPSRTERLRQGGDRIFFFFLSFYKETKTRVNSYEHKSFQGQRREWNLPRGRWDDVLEGGDGVCPEAAGRSPARNSQK